MSTRFEGDLNDQEAVDAWLKIVGPEIAAESEELWKDFESVEITDEELKPFKEHLESVRQRVGPISPGPIFWPKPH